MKVKFFHDGSGNFTGGVTEGMDGTDENQIAGMKLVLTSVAQGFGQAFVFAAGLHRYYPDNRSYTFLPHGFYTAHPTSA